MKSLHTVLFAKTKSLNYIIQFLYTILFCFEIYQYFFSLEK